MHSKGLIGLLIFGLSTQVYALSADVYSAEGQLLGTVNFEDSNYGLLITPKLSKLPPGFHGFHIHQVPNCGDHGMNAGGHLDPTNTGTHQGPYGAGHLGDLPVLAIDNTGEANTTLLAPRLRTEDVKGHALMIHAGGDNYKDVPPLGGGGARIGCGKISD